MTWLSKHPWWPDALLLKLGLITRTEATRRGVPHIKAGTPEQTELDLYQTWALWRAKGALPPRPVILKGWLPEPEYWTALRAYIKKHKLPPPPPPAPEGQPKPPPSWTLPSPLILSGVYGDDGHANDPNTGQPYAGIGTIGDILVPGVCPLWECRPFHGEGRGLLGQIEGLEQLQVALDLLEKYRVPGDHLAVVGTGNVPAVRMIAAGVNVAFYELNAQAGWEPWGNTNKLLFQGHQDGWPHVYPSYGVYVPVSLQEYAAYHPQVTDDGGKTWSTSPTPQGLAPYYAVFSGQGMGDTDSWGAL